MLYSAKTNSRGLCPIRCRITYKKVRKDFSTGKFINPKHWNRKLQRAEPPEPDAELVNTQLSLIKTKLSQAFLFLQVKGTEFNVDDIYRQYKGETNKREFGVMEVYNLHSDRIKKLIGIDIKDVTYKKYLESGVHLKDFIKHKFKSNDIQIKRLKSSFLDQYEYFLKTEKKLQQSTLNKAIQRFRRVVKYAISEDYLIKDPFMLYKVKSVKKEVKSLTPEQLKKLEGVEMKTRRLEYIKDLFIFCCYTGLGFKEMKNLKQKDIAVGFDGELWVTVKRQKTERCYKVPLLPKAKEIRDKYYHMDSKNVFNSISNTNFNAYLKEIASIVGIDINLTHHIARKTFATTILLYNGIPMDIVSKLLGHSKIQTTQEYYGKISDVIIKTAIHKLRY